MDYSYERGTGGVSALGLVVGEAAAVTAAMRRNARWQTSGGGGAGGGGGGGGATGSGPHLEPPLLSAFKDMRDALDGSLVLTEVDPGVFLDPFLAVVRSPETSGPITTVALQALGRFCAAGLVVGAGAGRALNDLARAVVECRFDPTNAAMDEVVLSHILRTLRAAVTCTVGHTLSDEMVCEIMQTCFRLCFQTRLSPLLRNSAVENLDELTATLFVRLREMEGDKADDGGAGGGGGGGTNTCETSALSYLGDELASPAAAGLLGEPGSGDDVSIEAAATAATAAAAAAAAGVVEAENAALAEAAVEAAVARGILPGGSGSDDGDEASGPSTPNRADLNNNNNPAQGPPSAISIKRSARDGKWVDGHDGASPARGSPGGSAQASISAAGRRGAEPSDVSGFDAQTGTFRRSSAGVGGRRGGSGAARYGGLGGEAGSGRPDPPPYSVASINEIYRFAVSLIDPTNFDPHVDVLEMQLLGLRLVVTALEAAGAHIPRFATLLGITRRDVCRLVFQIVSNPPDLEALSMGLRVVSCVYASLRCQAKVEFQLFVEMLTAKYADARALTYEQRETIMEWFVEMSRRPAFFVELFVNYDSDVQAANLLDTVVKFLSKNAFPVHGVYTTHVLALDSILAAVSTMARRSRGAASRGAGVGTSEDVAGGGGGGGAGAEASLPEAYGPDALRAQRELKRLVVAGAEQFNIKPKKGIAYWQQVGVLPDPLDATVVANLLRTTAMLDKAQVGEYIAGEKEFNIAVCEAYLETFDFGGMRIDQALRLFLESFLIPGEAQKIGRVMEKFGLEIFRQSPGPMINSDSAEVLAFSIVMLNTDQHSSSVRKPMELKDYVRNVRGQNPPKSSKLPPELPDDANRDFDPAYLEQIFTAIHDDQIAIVAPENSGAILDRQQWKSITHVGTQMQAFAEVPAGATAYDRDIFGLMWGHTIAALSVIFDVVDDVAIIQRAIDGFYHCARVSSHYAMSDVFDNLIVSLCRVSALQNADGLTATDFGTNLKAQMAAISMLAMARKYGDHLREGWPTLLDGLITVFRWGLLPSTLTAVSRGFANPGAVQIPRPVRIRRTGSTSLFDSISSFFTAGAPAEGAGGLAGDKQAVAIRHARECIAKCKIDVLFAETRFLERDSLLFLLRAIVKASNAAFANVLGGGGGEGTSEANGAGGGVGGDGDDVDAEGAMVTPNEAMVAFCLERLVDIGIRNRDRFADIADLVLGHVTNVLRNVHGSSLYVAKRAVVGLLRLAVRALHKDDANAAILAALPVLAEVGTGVWFALAEEVVAGLDMVLSESAAYVNTYDAWRVIFGLLRKSSSHATASSRAFATLERVGLTPVVHVGNFSPFVKAVSTYVSGRGQSLVRALEGLDVLGKTISRIRDNAAAEIAAGAPADDRLPWAHFWQPAISAFTLAGRDPRMRVRHASLALLARTLVLPEMSAVSGDDLQACFEQLLFDLLNELLKPLDTPANMEDTRLRAVSLLAKAFLTHLPRLAERSQFSLVWMSVIRFMQEYQKADESEVLREAVPQNLKNMLLVMATSDIFGDPKAPKTPSKDGPAGYSIWPLTWQAVEAFVPGVQEEIVGEAGLLATSGDGLMSPVVLASPPPPRTATTSTSAAPVEAATPGATPAPATTVAPVTPPAPVAATTPGATAPGQYESPYGATAAAPGSPSTPTTAAVVDQSGRRSSQDVQLPLPGSSPILNV